MIRLLARKNSLQAQHTELITSGSVNVYTVQYTFDSAWDGLQRTACFRAGTGEIVSQLLTDTNVCTIPWEVLTTKKQYLYAGVQGSKDGTVVLPTIWVNLGEIQEGASLGETTQPPTPTVYDQILASIGDLSELETAAKDSLVDAINELYENGGSGGGTSGKDGGYYTPSVDAEGNLTWTASDASMPSVEGANIKGPQGEKGDTGDTGPQGPAGVDGAPGQDGAPGEDGGYYTPAVDGEGNLTWTASKEDMPPVAGTNIRGPAGEDGAGVPEIAAEDEGKILGVLDGSAAWVNGGSGSGNVSSPEITTIRVMDKADYDGLETKDPNTVYLLRG